MRRADQIMDAQIARNGFLAACHRILELRGFIPMDGNGTWAYGLHVYPDTSDALKAAGEPAFAEAWARLTEQAS